MARGAEIEDFAGKLRQAVGRANLSRAQVAQLVGVDKSVVARWLSGAVRPADHSLAALGNLLAQHIPGFSRADWDLAPPDFAARLGIAAPANPAAPAPAAPLGMPPAAGTAEQPRGSLPLWLAEMQAWSALDGLDLAAERFAGSWLFLYSDLRGSGRLYATTAEIRRGATTLDAEFLDGSTRYGRRGPAIANGPWLYQFNASPERNRTYGVFFFHGSLMRTAVLDGFLTQNAGGQSEILLSGRILGFRMGNPLDDPAAEAARFARLIRAAHRQNGLGWEEVATPLLLATLRNDTGNSTTSLRAGVNSLAASEEALEVFPDSPLKLELRETLLALRAWLADTPV